MLIITNTTVGLAQLFVGGTLANYVGRLWALRISIFVMCIGVVVQSVPNTFGVLIFGRLLTYVLQPCLLCLVRQALPQL